MTRPAAMQLDLGPEQIARLLPHRPPLVLVDHVARFVPGPRPRLRAGLTIRGDEPVFAAHFPGRPIWPGAYMLEGLAQAAGLLLALERMFATHGAAAAEALGRTPLSPELPRPGELPRSGELPRLGGLPIPDELPRLGGLLARAEIRFVRPVTPPAELIYELRRRGGLDGVERVDGRVELGGEAVAEASLVIALEPSEGPRP